MTFGVGTEGQAAWTAGGSRFQRVGSLRAEFLARFLARGVDRIVARSSVRYSRVDEADHTVLGKLWFGDTRDGGVGDELLRERAVIEDAAKFMAMQRTTRWRPKSAHTDPADTDPAARDALLRLLDLASEGQSAARVLESVLR